MKRVLWVLFLPAVLLAGCGGSSSAPPTAQPSAFCQSVSTVTADVNDLKSLKANPSLSGVSVALQKLNTDVKKAISEAKSAPKPQVDALKSSVNALKSTLTQVKDRKVTLKSAVPTIKSQAQTVSHDWQALTKKEKC